MAFFFNRVSHIVKHLQKMQGLIGTNQPIIESVEEKRIQPLLNLLWMPNPA
jgi:hypothetical protein